MKSWWVIALIGLSLAGPVNAWAENPHSEAEVKSLRSVREQLQVEIEGFKRAEQRLQDEIKTLHQQVHVMEERLSQLEGKTVLSMPELVVKEKKEYVCTHGHLYEELPENKKCPMDGEPLSEVITYQKEKAYRRESIEEKIESALEDEASRKISVGISATGILQQAIHSGREAKSGGDDLFGAGSADLFFIARPALYTTLFADLESIGSFSPNRRIPTLSALNGDDTRLDEDSELNLRELWLASQFFKQTLGLTAGHVDLTNYFDLNLEGDESLAELYYNFHLTEHIKISPHLQWLWKSEDNPNLLLPGLRVQVDF